MKDFLIRLRWTVFIEEDKKIVWIVDSSLEWSEMMI